MDVSYETLTVLAFITPGFISTAILGALTVRKTRQGLPLLLEALAFSFAAYAAVTLLSGQSAVRLSEEIVGQTKTHAIAFNAQVVIPILVIAILLPTVIALFVSNDWHMTILRKAKVTRRTSRDTLWLDVFTDQRSYVIVNFKDGRRVFGYPTYYSDDAKEGMVYLRMPAWIEGKDYLEPEEDGILITKDLIETVEFLNLTPENATPRRTEEHS